MLSQLATLFAIHLIHRKKNICHLIALNLFKPSFSTAKSKKYWLKRDCHYTQQLQNAARELEERFNNKFEITTRYENFVHEDEFGNEIDDEDWLDPSPYKDLCVTDILCEDFSAFPQKFKETYLGEFEKGNLIGEKLIPYHLQLKKFDTILYYFQKESDTGEIFINYKDIKKYNSQYNIRFLEILQIKINSGEFQLTGMNLAEDGSNGPVTPKLENIQISGIYNTDRNETEEYILTYNRSKNTIKINGRRIPPKCEYLTKAHYNYLINICKLHKETYTLEEIGGGIKVSYSQISKLNKAFCNLLESFDIPPKKLLFSTRDKSRNYDVPFFEIKVIL